MLDGVDELAGRLASKDWASRSRGSRRRWALILAAEILVVSIVSGVLSARVFGDPTVWFFVIAFAVWFGVFLWILVGDPRRAFVWALLGIPAMLVVPIVAALIVTR